MVKIDSPVSVVAGGAGFIGKTLCRKLMELGHHVICIDSMLTSDREMISVISDGIKLGDPTVEMYVADITESVDILFNLIRGSVDYVFNLASPASPVHYLKYPIHTLRAGSIGTMNLARFAASKNASFLIASTSEVYGDPLINPQPESYWGNVNPNGIRSVYDESKRFSEAVTMAYHREFGLDTRIARIFNTYGPGMQPSDGRIIPNFINQALNNKPITIYGDGKQTRSLCYVDDTVDGLIKLMMSKYTDPVNIGNPDERTVIDIAINVQKIVGSKCRIVHEELPEDDPKCRCPDITTAKRVIDWTPKTDIYHGLEETVEYFRQLGRS